MSEIGRLFLDPFIKEGGLSGRTTPLSQLHDTPYADLPLTVGRGEADDVSQPEAGMGLVGPLPVDANPSLADEGGAETTGFGQAGVIEPEIKSLSVHHDDLPDDQFRRAANGESACFWAAFCSLRPADGFCCRFLRRSVPFWRPEGRVSLRPVRPRMMRGEATPYCPAESGCGA